MTSPLCVLVFSGKRKSGKDYVTDLLSTSFGPEKCSVMRLSAPLKLQYAKENNLDYSRLLDASDYKEMYRADMIKWGEDKRNQDPGFFAHIICSGPGSEKPIWIISDARRKTDIDYFTQNYGPKVVSVRVNATEDVRRERGWTFTSGVDDAESECGLDTGVNFDIVIDNNGDHKALDSGLQKIKKAVGDRS